MCKATCMYSIVGVRDEYGRVVPRRVYDRYAELRMRTEVRLPAEKGWGTMCLGHNVVPGAHSDK